jgi:hypothetical protein
LTPSPYIQTAYVSAHSRARLVVILLVVGAIVNALTIVAEAGELMFPQISTEQELRENPGAILLLLLHGVLGLITIAIYVATVIGFSMWLYRCNKNLKAFGYWTSQIAHSPGWAVGSFFVPIVNLFVPYRATKEIWQKSRPPESVPFSFSDSPPGFFPAWWAFWLSSNFAGNIYFRMSFGDAPHEATLIVGIISDILSIAAAGIAIMVVREIDRRQEETRAHLMLMPELSGPPPPPVFHPPGSANQTDQGFTGSVRGGTSNHNV